MSIHTIDGVNDSNRPSHDETIRLPSVLDGPAVDQLRTTLYQLIENTTPRRIIVDSSQVTILSDVGLGVLVAAALLAQRHQVTLTLSSPSQRVLFAIDRHPTLSRVLHLWGATTT
jgi:anti-anti-sigma factor